MYVCMYMYVNVCVYVYVCICIVPPTPPVVWVVWVVVGGGGWWWWWWKKLYMYVYECICMVWMYISSIYIWLWYDMYMIVYLYMYMHMYMYMNMYAYMLLRNIHTLINIKINIYLEPKWPLWKRPCLGGAPFRAKNRWQFQVPGISIIMLKLPSPLTLEKNFPENIQTQPLPPKKQKKYTIHPFQSISSFSICTMFFFGFKCIFIQTFSLQNSFLNSQLGCHPTDPKTRIFPALGCHQRC